MIFKLPVKAIGLCKNPERISVKESIIFTKNRVTSKTQIYNLFLFNSSVYVKYFDVKALLLTLKEHAQIAPYYTLFFSYIRS